MGNSHAEMLDSLRERKQFGEILSGAISRAYAHRKHWHRASYVDFLLLAADDQANPIRWLKSIRGPAPACACALWLVRRIEGKVSIDG